MQRVDVDGGYSTTSPDVLENTRSDCCSCSERDYIYDVLCFNCHTVLVVEVEEKDADKHLYTFSTRVWQHQVVSTAIHSRSFVSTRSCGPWAIRRLSPTIPASKPHPSRWTVSGMSRESQSLRRLVTNKVTKTTAQLEGVLI